MNDYQAKSFFDTKNDLQNLFTILETEKNNNPLFQTLTTYQPKFFASIDPEDDIVWDLPNRINESEHGCPEYLLPWEPIYEDDPSQLEATRLCLSGCCQPCGWRHDMSPTAERLQETFVVLSYLGFLLSLFLILSHFVNKRLTINAYTTLQSLAIVIFCIPLSFFLIDEKQTVCYDPITQSTGKTNGYCEGQGILFVLGFHSVVLSVVVRVFSNFMLIVCERSVPRVYLTIVALGVSGAFAAASAPFITYEGGVFCHPAPKTSKALLQIPLLIYSCIGIVFQLITVFYVTRTLIVIKVAIMRSHIPSNESLNLSFKQKATIFFSSYYKSTHLLWRSYITSMFLSAVMVFVTLQYILSTRQGHSGKINDRLATLNWVGCILSKNKLEDCSMYIEGQGMYVRTLISVILLQIFTLVFLMTEYRIFLFRAWLRFLKKPSAIFSRKKSDEILDTLDDSLSNVWLPEKFQNSFLGSLRVKRNESDTQKALERQLVLFTENQKNQQLFEQDEELKKQEEHYQIKRQKQLLEQEKSSKKINELSFNQYDNNSELSQELQYEIDMAQDLYNSQPAEKINNYKDKHLSIIIDHEHENNESTTYESYEKKKAIYPEVCGSSISSSSSSKMEEKEEKGIEKKHLVNKTYLGKTERETDSYSSFSIVEESKKDSFSNQEVRPTWQQLLPTSSIASLPANKQSAHKTLEFFSRPEHLKLVEKKSCKSLNLSKKTQGCRRFSSLKQQLYHLGSSVPDLTTSIHHPSQASRSSLPGNDATKSECLPVNSILPVANQQGSKISWSSISDSISGLLSSSTSTSSANIRKEDEDDREMDLMEFLQTSKPPKR